MSDYLSVCRGTLDVQTIPPACTGQWIAVQTDVIFDLPSAMNTTTASEYFSAGFVLVAIITLSGFAVRSIVHFIRGI